MRNKAIFLATTAVALLTGSGAAQAGNLYISVFGGSNWQHNQSGSQTGAALPTLTSTTFSMDADTGFVLGGAIGTSLDKWATGLRVEMEAAYRRNDLNGRWQATVTDVGSVPAHRGETGTIGANTSTFSIMANVWYDIAMGWKAVPYVGGGVGWARSKMDGAVAVTHSFGNGLTGNQSSSTNQEANGFAWQLGAGVNYEVSPGVDLGIGYRYFNGPNFDPMFVGKNPKLAVPFDNENHSVQVNLTIGIN
jgi:opacity protein-like surface antigen